MSEEAAPDEIPAPRKLTVASLGATPALTARVGIAWISNQAYQEGFALEQHLFGFGVLVWVFCLSRRPVEVQQGTENPPQGTENPPQT